MSVTTPGSATPCATSPLPATTGSTIAIAARLNTWAGFALIAGSKRNLLIRLPIYFAALVGIIAACYAIDKRKAASREPAGT